MQRAASPDVKAMRERGTHTHTSNESSVLKAPEEAPEDQETGTPKQCPTSLQHSMQSPA
jgi:hypothetical protein